MSTPTTGATGAPRVPDKPALDGLEERWADAWEEAGTYRFDPTATRAEVFSIDTPPPTVSGSLHMGSVFGYVQTDAIARYRRMRGWRLFYPMGWDDNGLPTERRVQTYYGVTCDPSLPYDPDFRPPEEPGHDDIGVSRPNFIALCHELTAEDEQAFEELWRRVGLSVDWTRTYATIGDTARRVSQRMFLHNLARGEAYTSEAPTMWDVDYQTAVAQAEMEDKEQPGAYHRLRFDDIEIETTRPELVAACVALVAHPDDERYADRFGTTVHTPLFGVEVPVLAHRLAEPDKGSGIAMICTFGDITDVVWWRELDLPTRSIITRSGRITETPPPGVPDGEPWRAIAGKTIKQAQRAMVELLAASGEMVGEPRPIVHPVKFYERGDRPLEIVTSRQWFIRNGGRDDALRSRLLERATELDWHPPYMKVRFDDWVNGLNGDWLISRQRFFGVPIPIWYPLGADGEPDHDAPLVPDEARLPVDPTTDVPDGYTADQRGVPGGFVGRPRRHGHLGHVVGHAADRVRLGGRPGAVRRHLPHGPAAAGARDHPHLALLHPAALPPRARHRALEAHDDQRLDPRPGPQEDVQVEGQRRHADGPARGVRLRCRALLGLQRPARHRHGARHGRHEDRAPPGHQGAQRVEVRPGPPRRGPGAGHRGGARRARHRPAGPAGPAGRGGHGGPGGLRLRPGARADRGLLLVVLRRLRRAGQDARLRRGFDRPVRTRPAPPWPAHSPPCCASSPRSCPSSPRRCGAGGRRARCTRRPGPTVAEVGPHAGARPDVLDVAAEVLGAVRREKTVHKRSMRARVATLTVTGPPSALEDVQAARGDLVDAGGVDNLVTEEGPALSVEVVLADEA